MEHIYVDGSLKGVHVGIGVYIDSGSPRQREQMKTFKLAETAQLHEQLALIEGALLAIKEGFKPNNCTFYSDQQLLSDARVAEGVKHRKSYLRSLIACRGHFDLASFNAALVFLEQSHIKWVRGHDKSLGNRRVDYLAKAARKNTNPSKFDTWLKGLICSKRHPIFE